MSKLNRSLLWSGLLAAGIAACGDDVTVTPPPPPPEPTVHSVTVTPDGATVGIGANVITMIASVNADAAITNLGVTWSTSDGTKATIAADGKVTTISAGSVGIRACSQAVPSVCGAATLNITTAPAPTVSQVLVTPGNPSVTRPATGSTTLQFSAAVIGANNPSQVVTWSLPGAPANVTIGATTGLLTVQSSAAAGTVNVSACSTVAGFTNVCGFAAVNVIVPAPATLSISAVTWVPQTPGSCVVIPGQPVQAVVLTNVACQIEVTANVNAGDQQLGRLDVLIGGRVVASQTFPGTVAPQGEQADVSAPVDITLSVNTRQLRDVGGLKVPVIYNGNQSITANLYTVNGLTPVASQAWPVVMNNVDAFFMVPGVDGPSLQRTAVVAPAPVVSGGNTWFKGTETATGTYIAYSNTVPTAFNYSASSVCGGTTPAAATIAGTPTTGISVTGVFTCGGVEGQNFLDGANPAAALSYAPAVTGPDGTALATAGGPVATALTYTNVGSAFTVPTGPLSAPAPENRYNPISLSTIPSGFIDNEAPTVDIASSTSLLFATMAPAGRAVAANINFDQWWISGGTVAPDPITAAFQFTTCNPASSKTPDPGGVFSANCGISGYRAAADGGVGLAAGFPTTRVTVVAGAAESCTGATVNSGADLAVTLTSSSDAYRLCTYAEDQLANASSTSLAAASAGLVSNGGNKSNKFGVDNKAPSARLAGALDGSGVTPDFVPNFPVITSGQTVFNVSGEGNIASIANDVFVALPATQWGIEGQDDRSGFDQLLAVVLRPSSNVITRSNAASLNSAIGTCGAPTDWNALTGGNLTTLLSDGWVRNTNSDLIDCGGGTNGIFTYTGMTFDRALNVSNTLTSKYLIDTSRPTITGLGFPTGVLGDGTAGSVTSGTFSISAADNLDLNDAIIGFNYPAANFPTTGQTGVRYTFWGIFGTNFDEAALSNFVTVLNGQGFVHGPYVGRFDETCTAANTPAVYTCPVPPQTSAELTRGMIASAGYLAGTAWQPGTAFASVRDGGHNYPATPFGITVPMLPTQTLPISAPWSAANTFNFDASIAGSTVTVNHYSPTSLTLPYFDSVQLWKLSVAAGPLGTVPGPTANWVYCGVTSNVGSLINDNGQRRIWRWTMTAPTTGVCAESEVTASWRVLGIKGAAGLFTNTF